MRSITEYKKNKKMNLQIAEKYREDCIAIALGTFLSDYNFSMKPSDILNEMLENPSRTSPNYLLWADVEHMSVRHVASIIELLSNDIHSLTIDIIKKEM